MTLLEKIIALKSVFATETPAVAEDFTPEVAQEAKFLDAKLVDGTIVRVEGDSTEFKVGDALKVMTEAGEIVQAPEGMHELVDGTILVVDAEGKITEVRTPEVKEEEEMEVAVDAPALTDETDLAKKIGNLEKMVAELTKLITDKKEMMEKVEAENVSLKIENEKMSKAPLVKSTSPRKFENEEKLKDLTKKDKTKNSEMLNKILALKESKNK